MAFDPNAAALEDSGVFGLPFDEASARVVLVPVPFDATTSYRKGAAKGPAAILDASRQVDLFDLDLGRIYEPGIFLRAPREEVLAWNAAATAWAEPVIAAGGVVEGDEALTHALAEANALSAKLDEIVHADVSTLLAAGKIVGLVGGDHATPFGAIRAHAERFPGLGVLHVDAHADLRPAYEGFTRSHASIMRNVLDEVPGVARLVQVGIRDFSEEEHETITGSQGRVVTFFDADLRRAILGGSSWVAEVHQVVSALPKQVYVSFDIDGLDPALCPNTGTPVPGGLSFHEATWLFEAIVRSGRTIVGFDLNEVAPGEDDEWDANVGARLLYRLIGWTLSSQGLLPPRR
ncbi:MAG: agmatinase family protein [Myxococcales bacterium]|nr:agmatinase family protein [Myxococcales bacterium]